MHIPIWILVVGLITIVVSSIALLLHQVHDIAITIDDRTLQVPIWTFAAAMTAATVTEQAHLIDVARYEVALARAERVARVAKRSESSTRAAAEQTRRVAQLSVVRANRDARVAYTNALRRWLLSEVGQDWLASRGVQFP